ncbi:MULTISPECIES: hypothetical protein [Prochlorococcus]|uniref:hypothetical protein n=1 Tax=Prochlorococcus TaxID=1218 RepID=UPI0007B34A84|nr:MULTISPECIES: hypothetical protein [Prochlorococcus]KZR67258.1 hypothetical protein PMIT1312_00549 [Prochlorococcus marinus str. MIT 1312]NMO83790.1 hypothetical protein [Prochlorococcus sp. P1344]NMP12437.1 hypothetical protein [Prochlorococcus sp.P1363]
MNQLPEILDAGDGKTIDCGLALQATRHLLIALKLLLDEPNLQDEIFRELADMKVAYMLGGDHWHIIAAKLVDAVLEKEGSA